VVPVCSVSANASAHLVCRTYGLRRTAHPRQLAARPPARKLHAPEIIVSEPSADATRSGRTDRSAPARCRSSMACNDTHRYANARPIRVHRSAHRDLRSLAYLRRQQARTKLCRIRRVPRAHGLMEGRRLQVSRYRYEVRPHSPRGRAGRSVSD
jgi:hypothetical protein